MTAETGETVDVAARYPERFEALSAEIDAMLAEDVEPVREYHISDEAEEQLRSLGYVN